MHSERMSIPKESKSTIEQIRDHSDVVFGSTYPVYTKNKWDYSSLRTVLERDKVKKKKN